MPSAANEAKVQPPPQPYEPIRALLRAGKNDEAILKLCPIVVTRAVSLKGESAGIPLSGEW